MKHIIITILTLLSITLNAQIRMNTKQSFVDSTRLNATGDSLYHYQNGVLISTEAITIASTPTLQEVTDAGYLTTNNITIKGTGNILRLETDSDVGNKRLDLFVGSDAVARIAANQSASSLAFETVQTERMRISNTGNVGIGTDSPDSELDILGSLSRLRLDGSNASFQILSRNTANTSTNPLIFDADTYTFNRGGVTRITLDASGNLGLKVTPSAWSSGYTAIQNKSTSWFATNSRDANFGSNVFVNSNGNYAYIESSYSTLYTQYIGSHLWLTAPSGTASDPITFTQAMTLDANGRLGIGETSPSAKLHIGESGAAAQLWLQRTDGYNPVKLIGGTLADGNGFKITMNTTDAFAIRSNGNIGIRTTSPEYILDIGAENTDNPTDFIRLNPTNGNSDGTSNTLGTGLIWKPHFTNYTKRSAGIVQVGEGNYFRSGLAFFTNNSANQTTDWQERMRIDKDGNVGIGTTSPTQKLDVVGTVEADGFTINGVPVGTSTSSYWNASGGNINYTTGNVGIGTASPGEKLHVSGSIIAEEGLTLYDGDGNSTNAGKFTNVAPSSYGGAQISFQPINNNKYTDFRISPNGSAITPNQASIGVGHGNEVGIERFTFGTELVDSDGISAGTNKVNSIYQWSATGGGQKPFRFGYRNSNTSFRELMRIDSSGNVGIGTTSPSVKLQVNGQIIVGDVHPTDYDNVTTNPGFHIGVVDATAASRAMNLVHYGDTIQPASALLRLRRSRGTSVGDYTKVENGDVLGYLQWMYSNGTGWGTGGTIRTVMDGVTGTNDFPTRLEFFTTADGTTTNAVKMVIKNNGNVGIGTTSPNEKLDVRGRIEIQEQTDPSTAGSGLGTIYANSSNSKLYYRDDNGNNYDLTSTATTSDGSWTNSGTVTYLTDSGDKVGIGTATPQGFLSVERQFADANTLGLTVSDPRYSGLFQIKTNSSGFFFPAFEGYSGTETTVSSGVNLIGAIDSSKDVYSNLWSTVVIQGREYDNFPQGVSGVENASILSVNNWPSVNLFRIESDGGIFAPSLGNTTGVSANMYYNTTTDELMYITSSQRYKTNIRDYDRGIDDLMKLRPVYYQPKNSTTNNNVYNTGFIAEEVESIGLTEYIDYDENGLANSIHYSLMTAILTKATQEQQAIIETQEQKITDLETTIQALITRIENLENK